VRTRLHACSLAADARRHCPKTPSRLAPQRWAAETTDNAAIPPPTRDPAVFRVHLRCAPERRLDFGSSMSSHAPPPLHTARTVESWARAFVLSRDPAEKVAPPTPPSEWDLQPIEERLVAPGRPPSWTISNVGSRTPATAALSEPRLAARLLHTFLHHELQAAELMAWALLAFPETPMEFRQGLLRIAEDELRHLRGYAALLSELGFHIGDFPVRDWFWERVPSCATPGQFCALMGMGLEAANLEHAPAFAHKFAAVGAKRVAEYLREVAHDEVQHVRFGVRWFGHFVGPIDFETWRKTLPAPLTPLLMRGKRMDVGVRLDGGRSLRFVEDLRSWTPDAPGS